MEVEVEMVLGTDSTTDLEGSISAFAAEDGRVGVSDARILFGPSSLPDVVVVGRLSPKQKLGCHLMSGTITHFSPYPPAMRLP